MSNSPLVKYTKLSPNCTKPRKYAIDVIIIHCMAGNCTVETCGNLFANKERSASSNYGIGSDGRIALYVDEANRAWTSGGTDAKGNVIRVNGISGADYDHRAVTIEVANDGGAPDWHVSDKALAALVDLCTDICKRNGIKQLLWQGNKALVGQTDKQNMGVHRWFAPKACPGDYLYNKHGYIAAEVNKRLGAATVTPTTPATPKPATPTTPTTPTTPAPQFASYLVQITATTLNYRTGAGTNYPVKGTVKKNEKYTIVEEANGTGAKKWGKLKSGAGWISLDYCQKV